MTTLLLAALLAQDVGDDLRVTLKLKAPGAKSVKLKGALTKEPLDLQRGDDGTWSVVTPPAVPGFHYYWFDVDGLTVNDPAAKTAFGWGRECSAVEVPEKGVDWYDPKDVERGELRIRAYFSKTTGKWRRAFVYTPPGYERGERRYPVLYLQHGSGENERGWMEQGRANVILDNLIAAGKALPMILVSDTGYAARPGDKPTAAFEEVMLGELIPMIDASYRTLAAPEHRAMTGLSMGAGQTLQIALKHPETFAWIGALSGGGRQPFDPKTSYDGAFADATAFAKRCRLLYLCAGSAEERAQAAMRGMHEALKTEGVASVYYESPGTDHEWQTWRRGLHDLAPRLFRD